MYLIREMTIEDYEATYALWSATAGMSIGESDSKEAIASFLDRNPGHSFVCFLNGTIVGTVLCGHDGRRGYLYHVAVSETHRHKGIGKKLIKSALKSLSSVGIVKCHLMVFTDNETGNQFWESCGWERREDIFIYSSSTDAFQSRG